MLVLLSLAAAKNLSWLSDGPEAVRIDAAVTLPLIRGPSTRHLPAVQVEVPVGAARRATLAVVDLGGGWSTLTAEAAASLGVEASWERLSGEWRRVAVLPEVHVGGVVLTELPVEVVADADAGFTLGVMTLDALAAAVLPSEGVVRLVPAAEGPALVASIGAPVAASRQPSAPFTHAGAPARGDGTTLRVPGALRWGEAVQEGRFHIATDRFESRVAKNPKLPRPVQRGGEPYHDVEARLGDLWLAHTWTREDAAVADPDPDFVAELGYDVLYAVDLAVAPATAQIAFRAAPEVRFTADREVSVALARARFEQEEAVRPTEAPAEGRVQIGFDGPTPGAISLGDPGDPVIRDRNLDLAETLWRAGALDEAMPRYLAASQHAGDHCLTHLRLAERRLAWSGARQSQGFVVDLIRQPLERAGALWDAWLALDDATRQAIWQGQSVPGATVQVYQPNECQVAWATLVAASDAQGHADRAEALIQRYQGDQPAVDYARGLRLLRAGQAATAQPILAASKARAGVEPVDVQAALAIAVAATDAEEAKAYVRHLPHYRSDHELTTAFLALEAARVSGDAWGVAKVLRRSDERWLPGAIVAALAMNDPPPPWDPTLPARYAGAARVVALEAVHAAVSGDRERAKGLLAANPSLGDPDTWTARAVVAWLDGDEAGRVAAIDELRLRWPLLPVGQLGTLPVAAASGGPANGPEQRR